MYLDVLVRHADDEQRAHHFEGQRDEAEGQAPPHPRAFSDFGAVEDSEDGLVFRARRQWQGDFEGEISCIGEEWVFAREFEGCALVECRGLLVNKELQHYFRFLSSLYFLS